MGFQRVSIEEAEVLMKESGVCILDIRDSQSFQQGHAPGALQLTEQEVEKFSINAEKKAPLVIFCYHGNSSQGAAQYFSERGFEKVFSVDGGYVAWEEAGKPTE